MYAVLQLPDFPLQARLCQCPGLRWEAAGILDTFSSVEETATPRQKNQPRLIALTAAATAIGVETGMTAARGRARCGHLQVLPRDHDEEHAAHELLLETAARASADFESTAPGLVTIDLGASPLSSPTRPGALERLVHEWVGAFADHELNAQVGFAPNPDLAALAARVARPVRLFRDDGEGDFSADSLREQLAPLPLEVIDPPTDYHAILTLWGIGTLGDFTALPRDEVAERLGPDAADLWDRAAGRCRRLLRLVRSPADFSHAVDLDQELTTLEPLLFLIRRSLDTLTARLANVYLAASAIHLTLILRGDGGSREQVIRVPDPCRDAERLFRLIHTRLEDAALSRPVEGYRIELTAARPGEQPFHLFDTTLRDPNRFAETLAQLEALVGSENAGSPAPLDTHRPDAFAMRPFDPDASDGEKNAPALPAIQGSPLRRFRPPRRIELTTRRDPLTGRAFPRAILAGPGQIHGRIHHVAGPWPLSGDWWERDRRWRREEWDIELDDGSLYRLACLHQENDTPGKGTKQSAWHLDGVYG